MQDKINIEILKFIKLTLDKKKAENILIIDVSSKSILYSYIVIATILSQRHGKITADFLTDELESMGISNYNISGSSNWIMVDLGCIAIHLLKEEERSFYDFDGMWMNEERCPAVSC